MVVRKADEYIPPKSATDRVLDEVRELRAKLDRIHELAEQGLGTSQFTHARGALDRIRVESRRDRGV